MRIFFSLVFIILNLLWVSPCSAQVFSAGPMIGGGLSLVTYQKSEFRDQFDPKLKPSFRAGFSFSMPLTEIFIISSDLNYAMRSRKVFVEENEWTMNEYHHFIEFPILLNIKRESEIRQIGPFERIGPFTWYLGIGPNISYLLGGFGQLQTYGLNSNYKLSFNGKESDYNYITFQPVNRWQWGIDFNLALSSPINEGQEILTSLKFTYGHTHLGTADGSNMPILGFADNIAHNYKILTLSVAYLFYLDPRQLLKGESVKGQKIKTKAIGGQPSKKGKNINKIKRRRKKN